MDSLGIDLGTTNTVIASHGRPLAAPVQGVPEPIVPSTVAFPPDSAPLVGARARLRRPIDPMNTICSAKRVIGMRFGPARQEKLQPFFGPRLVQGPEGDFAFETRAGVHTPVDTSSFVVNHAFARAGVKPEEVESAVVTVPSSFDAPQREATVEAVRRAGLRRVGVVEEPVATAAAYLQRSRLRYAAVYDLGGGTFDVAIVDCQKPPFRVLAHAGDPFLGGNDVDRTMACKVAADILEQYGWDLGSERATFARLVSACEWAKQTLTFRERVGIPITEIDPAAPDDIIPYVFSRPQLRQLAAPLVQRTFGLCDEVLAHAGITAGHVQAVFLAGGSSLLPGLRDRVEAYFGKRPRNDLSPTEVVSMGASYMAARSGLGELLDMPLSRRSSQPLY